MGVMDWFKRGVGEMMIARPDDAKAHVVWKHPDPTIPIGSQLTVEADEKAVFFRDGKIVATLEPGRHTLTSANLPFLSNLVDSFTGGNVLIAEVFFVSTREVAGVKFGGPIGYVEDPKSGVPVSTMVHGEFSFRVTLPEQLITGLVGMGQAQAFEVRSWMKEQVLKVIRDRIAELLVKNRWPLLDVTSGAYTEELEQTVIAGLGTHVQGYGIQIVRLGNFAIAIDEADAANLKRLYTDAAYLRTVGGVDAYQRFAAGKAMLGAGEGMAKGPGAGGGEGSGLLGGAGLGVGLGMAQMLMQQQQQQRGGGAQPAPAAPAAPAAAPASSGSAASVGPSGAGAPAAAAVAAVGATAVASAVTSAVTSGGGAAAPAGPAAFCSSCGAKFAAEAHFCGQCGAKRG